MNLTTGTHISSLPTGAIDSFQAVFPLSIGMPSSPQTIRASLLEMAQFYGSQGMMIDPAYISGLDIDYSTSGSVSVRSGSAFIPSKNQLIYVTGTITGSFTPVATNSSGTWQHVYLYDNAGVASVEVSTTLPSAPYLGAARTKGVDTSRRYLGSVYCDAGGYLYRFTSIVQGNVLKMNWLQSSAAFPFQVASNLTSNGSIAITHLVPVTGAFCNALTQVVMNLAAGGDENISIGDENPAASSSNNTAELPLRFNNLGGGSSTILFLPPYDLKITGNTLAYTQLDNTGSNSLNVRIKGVSIQR